MFSLPSVEYPSRFSAISSSSHAFLEDGIFTSNYDVICYTSILSRVCVAWRRAAHANPRLWSKLCLSARKHTRVFGGDVMCIKEWVSRSQGLPLNLYLDLFIECNERVLKQATQILDSLLQGFRHQIRLLSLSGFPRTFLPLFRLPRSSLPLLEEVFLSMHCPGYDHASRNLFKVPCEVETFLETPRLKHVSIDDPEDASCMLSTALVLPLEQLTSLEVKSCWKSHHSTRGPFDLVVYLDTLRACESIVSLTVDFPSRGFHWQSGVDIFSTSLPALKSLDISSMGNAGSVNFLQGLTAPLLEDLTLRWIDQDISDLSKDVIRFQDRSATKLLSLTIKLNRLVHRNPEYTSPVTENVIHILASFPTAKSLWIDASVRESDNLFQAALDVNPLILAMVHKKDQPKESALLPELSYFQLGARPYPPDLEFMIRSRMEASLEKVSLFGWSESEIAWSSNL
ncbi:hypothetical protein BT96DRAFT_1026408 [Gymnopus androsaceus JB14]|uniref:F-box domain-containing protein n=1 Tax=Gymnopus androsaceus JB14 TaxID=1447944 RepID=A0A6A4GJT6_9AGAR|nr:hypothetical protein BT96DRAFT_1026408 [Gymnopus androsaceus JB14]